MKWNDDDYYTAYDHNYRTSYEEGEAQLGEESPNSYWQTLVTALLTKANPAFRSLPILDLGCGDGSNGLFLASLGCRYTGIDVSQAAIQKATERARRSHIRADFQVGNVLDLGAVGDGAFPLIIDSYCFHMLVIDEHRRAYFRNVGRVLADGGRLILLSQQDKLAIDVEVRSFGEFCKLTGTNPNGIPFQKKVNGNWVEVEGKKCFLMGRARSAQSYRKEFADAGFAVEHEQSWEDDKKLAFILRRREDCP